MLREGDYDFAIKAIEEGNVGIDQILEDVKIFQAELEIQNEELRHSQEQAEQALRDFSSLFACLPLPTLVIDKIGVILDGNAESERQFELNRKQLSNHFFPRFLQSNEQGRLHKLVEKAEADGEGVIESVNMRTANGNSFIGDIHLKLLPDYSKGNLRFATIIVDQTEPIKQREALISSQQALGERIKEQIAIYAISRYAQNPIGLEEFLNYVIKILPTGMRFPEAALASIELDGTFYGYQVFPMIVGEFCAPITVRSSRRGSLRIAYAAGRKNWVKKLFQHEEFDYINTAADLVGDFIDRWQSRRQAELEAKRNAALLELTTRAASLQETDLLKFALEQAEQLTSSAISYLHFVDDDQESLRFGFWSENSRRLCNSIYDSHYPISKAGIWADCLRLRRPVVHNDYPHSAIKEGLPEGHAELLRHMSVPVTEGDNLVMLVGVGNKDKPYDDGDKDLLQVLANTCWALVQKNRAMAQLSLNAAVFRHCLEGVMVTDASERIISVNQAFTRITGFSRDEALGKTPRILKSSYHNERFFSTLWQEINNSGFWEGELWNRRKDGVIYPQWTSISSVQNENAETVQYIGIFTDISDSKQALAHIEFLANHDPLTHLPNRALLRERALLALAHAKRDEGKIGMILIDLDHFKNINDSLGHPVGDRLLIEFAERLKICVRETDTFSRLGGDEFLLLLDKIKTVDNLSGIATKILDLLIAPFDIEGNQLTATCSMGISLYPEDGCDLDTLLKKADTALFQAKAKGRNNYKFFTEEMNQRVLRHQQLESDMRRAFVQHEFHLEYEPQFELSTGRIVGVEALIRWNHPHPGMIAPGEFIPVAEDSGFILELGHSILREACAQNRLWHNQGHHLMMAVNVSSVQFCRDKLLSMVADSLKETGLPAESLELELTASILFSSTENDLAVVGALRDMGVHFAIDDFGSGYSNLSYLRRFEVSKLKIDQSFIHGIPGDKDDAIIIAAIINLAKSLGIVCTAEGVETQEQLDLLKQMGCHQAQGFLLARPLKSDEMDKLLARQSTIGDA